MGPEDKYEIVDKMAEDMLNILNNHEDACNADKLYAAVDVLMTCLIGFMKPAIMEEFKNDIRRN